MDEAVEYLLIQQFVTHLAVEALEEGILFRLAGRNVVSATWRGLAERSTLHFLDGLMPDGTVLDTLMLVRHSAAQPGGRTKGAKLIPGRWGLAGRPMDSRGVGF